MLGGVSIEDFSNCSLSEAGKLISLKMLSMRDECTANIQRLQKRLEEITIEYREAAAQGDLRENSAYQEAGDELNSVNRDIVSESNRLLKLNELSEYEKKYVNIGLVVEMCTVRLEVIEEDKTSEVVFKVLPKGISKIDYNMISLDAPVIASLYRRGVGAVAVMFHRMTKKKIEYKILEIE